MSKDSISHLMRQRIEKLHEIAALDENAFPYRFEATCTTGDFLKDCDRLLESGETVSMAGRIMFRNKMGKVVFIRADDEEGRVQWMVSRQNVPEETFSIVKSKLDIGDICGVRGTAFRTKSGEPTLLVSDFVVLSKSIRALPEKFHGLKDKEVRYRQREVDMIVNRDSFKTFKTRSKIIAYIRSWMAGRDFDEVETPVLQMVYGGAEAAPFTTHISAIDTGAYLSISPELFLKRLTVGGFGKVYTITKNFRNEGIDATHYPEFTSLESYEAYSDYNDVMSMTQDLLHDLCVHIHGTTDIEYQSMPLSFKKPFQVVSYFEALRAKTGIDKDSSLADILAFIKSELPDKEIDLTLDRARLLDKVFGFTVEPNLVQPTFVIDYPKESTPLCRLKRGDERLIERFELYVMGMEIANAYSELNDPLLQRELLTAQSRLSNQNKEIPPEADEEFMRAIEYGLPPTGGLGIGIDRLVMFLTDSASIRDVILFPVMRPEFAVPGAARKEAKSKATETGQPQVAGTVKLFHRDMYMKEFEAEVVDVDRNLVWLNETAFYPHSGGQAGDSGTLNGQPVVDTIPDKQNKQLIIHVLSDEPSFEKGTQVVGRIDWEKRYRTMRLHSAAHIMEYFLLKQLKLSRVATLVDDRADVSKYRVKDSDDAKIKAVIADVENQANQFIGRNQVIDMVQDEKGYRTWISGEIHEGCGGTHVQRTDEIGPLRVTWEIDRDYLTVKTSLTE